jgi:DNA-directed RNA polymerase specialized sigma24 family protein
MMDYCEKQPWDDDLRQDLYVKLLGMEDKVIDTNYLSRMYTNLRNNDKRNEERRAELISEHAEDIMLAFSLDEPAMDPLDIMIQEEEVENKLKELSPLLRATLERVVVDGVSPEDLAEEEGTSANVIYQRVHEAKRRLTDE